MKFVYSKWNNELTLLWIFWVILIANLAPEVLRFEYHWSGTSIIYSTQMAKVHVCHFKSNFFFPVRMYNRQVSTGASKNWNILINNVELLYIWSSKITSRKRRFGKEVEQSILKHCLLKKQLFRTRHVLHNVSHSIYCVTLDITMWDTIATN